MSTLQAPIIEKEQAHHLNCMEIWGGNQSRADAITVPGIDAWVYSTPFQGEASGGDVHYVSSCGAGNISRFAVADVSGHGVEMDELAQTLRRLVRKHINTPNQARFAKALNQEFGNLAKEGKFATAILATYFAPNDHLIIVNAGHPRPLWYHARTGQWEQLDADATETVDDMRNLPLGIIEPTDFKQFAVQLEKGDIILIFTDAFIEASNASGRQLGESGLLEKVKELDATDPVTLGPAVMDAIYQYRGGAESDDDQTLIVLHHNADDPPHMSVGETLTVLAKLLGLKKV